MAYRKIDPRLWDDENFVELTTVEKLLWLYLLTGPHTTSLPGLWIVGEGELVDGLRLPAKSIRAGLEKLEAMGRLVVNPRLRLVRVPNAPRYNRPENARVLKAWFRLWSDIPECQQKYDHLAGIRAAVYAPRSDEQPAESEAQAAPLVAQWKATFGAVIVPERYQRADRKQAGAPPEPVRLTGGSDAGTVREPEQNGSRTVPEPSPNSSPVIYTVTASVDLDPGSQETPPETARAGARDDAQGRAMSLEAAALLAKLRSHECLKTIALEGTAAGLAAQVVAGQATLTDAERAIDNVGFTYAAEREHSPKPPGELSKWVANRIGWEARERKAQREKPGRGGGRQAQRGPQPQPGPMQVHDKKIVPPEERESSLV